MATLRADLTRSLEYVTKCNVAYDRLRPLRLSHEDRLALARRLALGDPHAEFSARAALERARRA